MNPNKKYKISKDDLLCSAHVDRLEDLHDAFLFFSEDNDATEEMCDWAERAGIGDVYEVKDFIVEVEAK